jgi:hypothetical protein
LVAVYGKRGVGKSSLLRQIQQMALGDYTVAQQAGLDREVPQRPRRYLTVYYSCDSMIETGTDLLSRLCNDQDNEDGLLRLVPNDGKDLVEFTRTKEVHGGLDLKVANWGAKGIESSKYARVVDGDMVQTFRNFVNAIISHQVKNRMRREGLLILLDEFDIIGDKTGLGSLIKSLSSQDLKFGICGIGHDLMDLVEDHASVDRLLEQGAIHVRPMPLTETEEIVDRAEKLFHGAITFDHAVKREMSRMSEGYPYFTQLLGKECVAKANQFSVTHVDNELFSTVVEDVKNGRTFPTLERSYQRAIGSSPDRQILLHLLAEQPEDVTMFDEDVGRVFLKNVRREAEGFNVQYVDQLLPRLLDAKFGPTLVRIPEKPGIYEFVNPVFRLYVRLRQL